MASFIHIYIYFSAPVLQSDIGDLSTGFYFPTFTKTPKMSEVWCHDVIDGCIHKETWSVSEYKHPKASMKSSSTVIENIYLMLSVFYIF